ncbi:glycosyltransferase family 4 protein [Novosphingobium sp. NBM11]|uniref:glycosyltransferase family 4 protein n=1 Tax=Novosphingobium sp. NBM11 TaxID=2596914 RepID=UPI00189265C6|nr:glycosyltransferase family 4 protein [Novosphingobium sp. NBM11]
MRILLISALYPPLMLGGAEDSARNWAAWLVANGHDVSVIRSADRDEAERTYVESDGVRVHVLRVPFVYPTFRFGEAPAWQKPIWHLQDHFSKGCNAAVGRILDQEQPDFVNVHLVQGLGYSILSEIGARRIPLVFTLHDLGLACLRMSMFKNGENCPGQCLPCRISARRKRSLVERQHKVAFVSPSRANLETLERYFPLQAYPCAVHLNPNAYPVPRVARTESAELRLLYAGRIHSSKGVDILLEAVAQLADHFPVRLALAGRGQQEAELRARYGDKPWCRFLGFVSQQELADHMAQSDLLCAPSIWAENSPGVVVQALATALPVMASDRGGIPELVRDGVNGRLVSVTSASEWAKAIRRVIVGEEALADWRAYARENARKFAQDTIARRLLAWITDFVGQPA